LTHLPANVPALLLAAGRGERMRPLTDTCPKPLLAVQSQPLLQWHLQALARAGVTQAVINTAWLGAQIEHAFGEVFVLQPSSKGREKLYISEQIALSYSREGADFGRALETAGGICRALPLLCPAGQDVFWVLAGDVFTPQFEFAPENVAHFLACNLLAHIWLIPNPPHNPGGDFGWDASTGLALNLPKDHPERRWTYSTIGLYRRALFEPPCCSIPAGNPQGLAAPLAPLLRAAMDAGQVSAAIYPGPWTDVGTPERLAALNATG
jgi:MurNAc alpha-1-phosphate uridylyltransferase